MPTYEYKCSSCGKEFEYQQRMSDAPKDVCEACGGKLERLISRTAFQLKGGGWYKDLYSSTKPADGGGGGDKKPTEAKPAASESSSTSSSPAPAPASSSTGGGSDSGGSKSGGGSTATAAAK